MLTSKDSSNVSRNYYTASEIVYVHIGPSLPSDSSLIVIAPDGTKSSVPADSTPITISASQKATAGWYLLRLQSDSGIVFATSMFKVAS
jgi:hypothetical protein